MMGSKGDYHSDGYCNHHPETCTCRYKDEIMEKKTSAEWEALIPKEYSLIITDPDGWDRTNYQYSFHKELITFDEFQKRLFSSTISCNKKFLLDRWDDAIRKAQRK